MRAKIRRITIINQDHQGAGIARNKGIKKAQGKWLWFPDADDFFLKTIAQKLYECGEKNGSDIVICKSDIIDKNNNRYEYTDSLNWKKINFTDNFSIEQIKDLSFTNYAVWNKLYRRDFILNKHIFFQSLQSCNDVAFGLISLSEAKVISIVHENLYIYRSNASGNITSTRGKYAQNSLKAAEYVREELIKRDKWGHLSDIFYFRIVSSLRYEYDLASWQIKVKMLRDIRKFFPSSYFRKSFSKERPLLSLFFKKTKQGEKRIIRILGITVCYHKR